MDLVLISLRRELKRGWGGRGGEGMGDMTMATAVYYKILRG